MGKLEHYAIDDNGCWIWQGGKTDGGYGITSEAKPGGIGRYNIRAHRLFYEHHKGPVGDMCVLHRCDVRLCVNPEHLFLGTRRENFHDMQAKGRMSPQKGTSNPRSKLTDAQALEIYERADVLTTPDFKRVGPEYGVGWGCIRDIKKGKAWCHVTHAQTPRPVRRAARLS